MYFEVHIAADMIGDSWRSQNMQERKIRGFYIFQDSQFKNDKRKKNVF